jgi:hypothetical protein
LNLEFAPPLDYKEPNKSSKAEASPGSPSISKAQAIPGAKSKKMDDSSDEEDDTDRKFKAFTGTGYTLKSPSGKSPIRSPGITATSPTPKASTSPMTKIVNKYAPVCSR